jgi:hypothetical protein
MKIEIDVDPSKKEIVIKDGAGNERYVKSIVICGGDATAGKFYLFGWGSSADGGWALAHSLKATEDPFYKRLFDHFFRWLGINNGMAIVGEEPEAILKRWEAEDKKNTPTYN